MKFRGYRKRDPQWTDAVCRNIEFKAGGGKMLAEDSEGNKVELFTNKVLPVDKSSKDTKELKGNLVGISNVAKYERARRELRPSEDKRARVREISRDVFGDKIHAAKELWGKRQPPPWLCT